MNNRKIVSDKHPSQHSEEDITYALNMCMSEQYGTPVNNLGSKIQYQFGNTDVVIAGTIQMIGISIIFYGIPSSSFRRIGIFDGNNLLEVSNTTGLSDAQLNLFGFDTDSNIVGTFTYTASNEIILAYTDGINKPRILNIGSADSPTLTDINSIGDTYLFPDTKLVGMANVDSTLQLVVSDNGGELLAGIYYIRLEYIAKDGSIYAASVPFTPIVVPSISAGIDTTNYSIQIKLGETMSTDYPEFRFSYVYERNGVREAYYSNPIPTSKGTTGSDIYLTDTKQNSYLEESVFIEDVKVNACKAISSIEDKLYIANLKYPKYQDDAIYQTLVNGIVFTPLASIITNKNRNRTTFMPGEVYAMYARLIFTDGSKSKAFHIPGREYDGVQDTSWSTSGSIPRSSGTYNASDVGTMGYWENDSELYPPGLGFPTTGDSSGSNRVRHHRFPELKTVLDGKYPSSNVGASTLPELYLRVTVPSLTSYPEISDIEILYARRTISESTIYATDFHDFLKARVEGGAPTNYANAGWGIGTSDTVVPAKITEYWESAAATNYGDVLKINSVDAKALKPSEFTDMKIDVERYFRVNVSNDSYSGVFPRPPFIDANITDIYIDVAQKSTQITSGFPVNLEDVTVEDGIYVPANSIINLPFTPNSGVTEFDNYPGEECLVVKLNKLGRKYDSASFAPELVNGSTAISTNIGIDLITAFLTLRRRGYKSLYDTFQYQELVSTGILVQSGATIIGECGDVYAQDHSVVNLGDIPNGSPNNLPIIRSIARYPVYSRIKVKAIDDGSDHTSTYPQTFDVRGLLRSFNTNPDISLDEGANEWTFDNSLLQKSNVVVSGIHGDVNDFIGNSITTIRYSQEQGDSNRTRWRDFKALDFYIQPKTKGEIVKLQSLSDKLIIHHKNGLYLTRDIQRLLASGSISTIVLGSGQLFEPRPQELIPDVGTAGITNPQSGIMSKQGYIFMSNDSRLYLLNDRLSDLSNSGMAKFFDQYMNYEGWVIDGVSNETISPISNDTNSFVIPISLATGSENKGITDLYPYLITNYTVNGVSIISVGGISYYQVSVDETYSSAPIVPAITRYLESNLELDGHPLITGEGFSLGYSNKFNRVYLNKNRATNIIGKGRFKGVADLSFDQIDKSTDQQVFIHYDGGTVSSPSSYSYVKYIKSWESKIVPDTVVKLDCKLGTNSITSVTIVNGKFNVVTSNGDSNTEYSKDGYHWYSSNLLDISPYECNDIYVKDNQEVIHSKVIAYALMDLKDESISLSYSFESKGVDSFHTYGKRHYIRSGYDLFALQDYTISKMDSEDADRGNYDGEVRNSIFELSFNFGSSKFLQNISIRSFGYDMCGDPNLSITPNYIQVNGDYFLTKYLELVFNKNIVYNDGVYRSNINRAMNNTQRTLKGSLIHGHSPQPIIDWSNIPSQDSNQMRMDNVTVRLVIDNNNKNTIFIKGVSPMVNPNEKPE